MTADYLPIGNCTGIEIINSSIPDNITVPFYDQKVHAGFLDTMDDAPTFEKVRSLNEILVSNPISTYYGRMKGDAMADEGIREGDILVIDKAVEAQDGDLVIATCNGIFYIRYLILGNDGTIRLSTLSKRAPDMLIGKEDNFSIWGVVTFTIEKKN